MLPGVKPTMFYICILARILLAYTAYAVPSRLLSSIFYMFALAFFLLSVGVVNRDVGREAGGNIWWKNNRIVHAILFFLAAEKMNEDLDKGETMSSESAAYVIISLIFGSWTRFQKRTNLFN